MPRLPINQWDTGKTARDKINESWNELLNAVENFRPHIENGVWWIGNLNTWISAEGRVYFKTEDGYFKYKTSTTERENVLALESLKVKGDTGVGIDDISSENKGEYTLMTITLSNRSKKTINLPNGRDGVWTWDMLKSANLSDLTNKATARSNLDVYSKAEVTTELSKKSNTAHNHDSTYYKKAEMDEKLGKKADLINGLIPSSQLPSYVDDVLEYTTRAQFPTTWEKGKIYIDISTDKSWRWSGSTYIEIKANPWSSDAVAEGTTNKYFTDTRKNEITTEINKKMSIQDYDSNKNGVVDKSEGVVNQNWTVIKTRTGTKAQHTAVGTKDANTLYLVTES